MNNNTYIQDRTRAFGVRVIKAYCELNKRHFDDAAKVLSKQFLRSGTSIGANCAEARFAQSTADYLSKYYIALKEASETFGAAKSPAKLSECSSIHWIKIMIESDVISKQKFDLLLQELNEIISILVATTQKIKTKSKS
ncbi:MAG: four helix bundle protein [Pleurocapsa minor HA4230-MV1]|jgi:four helix bundle protein|nr:four helix bundle protein [Pleurocapsa minor HA4230-MV1]